MCSFHLRYKTSLVEKVVSTVKNTNHNPWQGMPKYAEAIAGGIMYKCFLLSLWQFLFADVLPGQTEK